MNSFANSLFSLMFGWARDLIQRFWEDVASGHYNQKLAWLGDHWLWVALGLCLICTAVDFGVWMVRWRPYLVWRSMLRKASRLLHGEKVDNPRRFARGYQGGVGLEVDQEQPVIPQEDWEEEALNEIMAREEKTETQQHTFTRAVLRAASRHPWRDTGEDGAVNVSDADRRRRRFSASAYELPPMYASAQQSGGYNPDGTTTRRRRSERYERKRQEWKERLIRGDEDDYALLDGLPPVVNRAEAFHEPVFPRQNNSSDAYIGWQRPNPGVEYTDGQ